MKFERQRPAVGGNRRQGRQLAVAVDGITQPAARPRGSVDGEDHLLAAFKNTIFAIEADPDFDRLIHGKGHSPESQRQHHAPESAMRTHATFLLEFKKHDIRIL
ncbi:hypothetical protein SDC9_117220 [bioreactor metagenome]|uniref:Uncharacterized protein n=1 Tax=bioreactor metagenome TaxID=1076179 RepID=A0A645BXL8_9ZZZZ